MNQPEINFAAIQIYPAHLHAHASTDGIANAGALASELLAGFIKAEVFAAKLGDVNQAFNVHRVEGDKNAKTCRCSHHAAKFLAEMLTHVFAFEPGFYVTAGLVGSAFVGTAMQTGSLPCQLIGRRLFRFFLGIPDA